MQERIGKWRNGNGDAEQITEYLQQNNTENTGHKYKAIQNVTECHRAFDDVAVKYYVVCVWHAWLTNCR